MAEWQKWRPNGVMAEWQNGGMAEWQNGGMAECSNGGMAKMADGMADGMEEWRNGRMAEWRNGKNGIRMVEWLNGGNGYLPTIFMVHTNDDNDEDNTDTLKSYSINKMQKILLIGMDLWICGMVEWQNGKMAEWRNGNGGIAE